MEESNCVIVRVTLFKGGNASRVVDQEVLTGEDAAKKSVAGVNKILNGKIPSSWKDGVYRISILDGFQNKHELVEGSMVARWDIHVQRSIAVSVLAFEGAEVHGVQ